MRIYRHGETYEETFEVGDFVRHEQPGLLSCGSIARVWADGDGRQYEVEVTWHTRPFGQWRGSPDNISLDVRKDVYEKRLRHVPRRKWDREPPTYADLKREIDRLRAKVAEYEARDDAQES